MNGWEKNEKHVKRWGLKKSEKIDFLEYSLRRIDNRSLSQKFIEAALCFL